MDASTAGGIGAGLLSFTNTYMKAKQQGVENQHNQDLADMYKQNAQAGLLSKGMQVGPGGQVGYTPQQQSLNETANKNALNEGQATGDEYDPDSDVSKSAEQTYRQRIEAVKPGSGKALPAGESKHFYDTAYGFLPAQEKGQNEKDVAKLKGQYSLENSQIKADASSDSKTNKRFSDFSNALDPNKGRAGNLAKLQEGLNRADRLDALTNGGSNLDSRQQEEYAIGLQSLLGSGHASADQVKALVPSTAMGSAQKMKEWLFNSPEGLNNEDFVNKMKDTVARERGVMGGQLKAAQYGNISGYEDLKDKDPERFNRVMNDKNLDPDEYEYFKKNHSVNGYSKPQAAGGQQAAGGGLIQPTQTPKSGPKSGDIVKGYKFKGGDPSDKSNWKKQ